jgi:hypothetical protein
LNRPVLGDGITQAVREWHHRIRKTLPRDIAGDLSGMAQELAASKADAHRWLKRPEYEAPAPPPGGHHARGC